MRCTSITKARRLAEAIERAVGCGMFAQADRLAQSAARLMHASPSLTETIARLRLAQQCPETALAIVECSLFRTASLRLLKAACLIELGRVIEAQLDLHHWKRTEKAPAEALRLLAMIDRIFERDFVRASHNDDDGAQRNDRLREGRRGLLTNVTDENDMPSIALLMIDAAEHGRSADAALWARRLEDADALQAGVNISLVMESLGIEATAGAEGQRHDADRDTRLAVAEAQTLAMELIASEDVLSALVRGVTISGDCDAAELLQKGIELALPELTDEAIGCECGARLLMMLGRANEASVWAQRGAEINPMSASIALLVHELRGDSTEEVDGDVAKRRAA